ncbi:Swt1 family HEPN domain-containing protein [Thermogemmatispora sp.]|uniref:Swt1 family HEPN domain-containing protein n=1 Tax=Thermogemmatispora sp. TaxID=1968838 RepID=UPI001D705691|nr:Swt1 family HEPN domain-containing protein [Thermogemmatispora sp.]MBX5450396.1 DUF499 domain-containing protein [Thermogemmatispora sp.]
MPRTNHEYVGQALTYLRDGLRPFVEREMQNTYGTNWRKQAAQSLHKEHITEDQDLLRDVQALLVIMWDQWNQVFAQTLGPLERSLVSELRDTRNRWAHQEPFDTSDAYRACDSAQRLLEAVSARNEADQCEQLMSELMRRRYEEQTQRQARRTSALVAEKGVAGLPSWRSIITPRPDVIGVEYSLATYAANLAQVVQGSAPAEYQDPREFFQRTHLTEGLRRLLTNVLRRLSGQGGDPVINLQTNFGGGKTHSLLALYHLFSGYPASELAGVESLLSAVNLSSLPSVQRVVIVGHAISPSDVQHKPDGCTIRTLWGELAWQLLGKAGYERVAEADRHGVSPGSDTLREIFAAAAPCLILIDEWIVHLRQLYHNPNLPAGTFEANLSFAQALSEAVSSTPLVQLVASLPASDSEAGGQGGKEALARLSQIFGRIEAPWSPASPEESFEIVRRRLFKDLVTPDQFKARDAVARTFVQFYEQYQQEFPSASHEASYEDRIRRAYPIHPELFDRLYGAWSTLERFQRTRGVLRLMASVVRTLWERNDPNPLIMPGSVPIDAPIVQDELMHYLEDNWRPVIARDVDGPDSLPLRLDGEYPNLGHCGASRRVARTLFLGTAPTVHSPNRGLTVSEIKLGCVMPGENISAFSDALGHLSNRSTHLWYDGQRYWYDTRVSITRLAQDRALQVQDYEISQELERRLHASLSGPKQRGAFARIHIFPSSSAEVPDENNGVALVILEPQFSHGAKDSHSPAYREALRLLQEHGNGRRQYCNTLIFLAADRHRIEGLKEGVREFLAWKGIWDDRESLNLDLAQLNQAQSKQKEANQTVDLRITESYCWLLIPEQSNARDSSSILLDERQLKMTGQEPKQIALSISFTLRESEQLVERYAPTWLRRELDSIPLWRGNHVSVKELQDFYGRYLYLKRLKSPEVLLQAIAEGVGLAQWRDDSFAYADTWDEERQRYLGLRAGQPMSKEQVQPSGLVVKAEVAAAQLEAEARARAEAERARLAQAAASTLSAPAPAGSVPGTAPALQTSPAAFYEQSQSASAAYTVAGSSATVATEPPQRRFYGAVAVDPRHLASSAHTIVSEVIEHLLSLPGAKVEVTLEIQATFPDGFPAHKRQVVEENCRTLKFSDFGFESE